MNSFYDATTDLYIVFFSDFRLAISLDNYVDYYKFKDEKERDKMIEHVIDRDKGGMPLSSRMIIGSLFKKRVFRKKSS